MAFKMNVVANLPGLSKEVPNAYLRVSKISGCKRGLTFELGYYESSESKFPFKTESFYFVPEGDTRWDAQAYLHLKTRTNFLSVIDC